MKYVPECEALAPYLKEKLLIDSEHTWRDAPYIHKYFFHTAMMDNEVLESIYPQLKDKLKNAAFVPAKFLTDDNVPTDGKSVVIDVYYKKLENGKTVLHYCKYVGSEILYSTENDEAGQNSATTTVSFGTSDPLPTQRAQDTGDSIASMPGNAQVVTDGGTVNEMSWSIPSTMTTGLPAPPAPQPEHHDIATESTYNYSKNETGKKKSTHDGVKQSPACGTPQARACKKTDRTGRAAR